ncbi:AAA family ATPase [Hominifimenecus sp. rT4P-3]|uniref:AAA family ATPase n=1 Tax=Hominifimenecus sp. rT4P-3 TaxID=3242979 RepID=UPI003DA4C7B4
MSECKREWMEQVRRYREQHLVSAEAKSRVMPPPIPYFGDEILEMAATALLQGENLLLTGGKATGKNILAENLAWMFGRPVYNISFHVNTDSSSLIGTDTFSDNQVKLRRGPVSQCAMYGGFGILDEINMAKNEAVSVLHAVLDHRRILDIPGYEKVPLAEETRFIGTMNYGYAGTRELNEALVSRFLVIDMPEPEEDTLAQVFLHLFPKIRTSALKQVIGLFLDLQAKASHGEITTRTLDLRGLIGALRTVELGLSPKKAVAMGVTNKTFDLFEKEIVEDVVRTRIPDDWGREDVFE